MSKFETLAQKWSYTHPDSLVRFGEIEGNIVPLNILRHEINITCPRSSDGTYFVESSSTNHVIMNLINSLNEKCLTSKMSLSKILSKTEKFCQRQKDVLEEEPTETIDELDFMEEALKGIEYEVTTLRQKLIDNLPKDIKSHEVKDVKELFSQDQVAMSLIEAYINIFRHYYDDENISIEPVNNNIYEWKLTFKKFNNHLDDMLETINETFGYKVMEGYLSFHPKLFPIYPPTFKFIRPRLTQSMMYRLSNIKILQFDFWSPSQDLAKVISKIYQAIKEKSNIDTESSLNNPTDYPHGAFHEFENQLIKLASLSGDANDSFEPLDTEKYPKNTPDPTEGTQSTSRYGHSKRGTVWKQGVGYGHGNTHWDIKAYLKAQEEKDRNITIQLKEIIDTIEKYNDEGRKLEIVKTVEDSYLIGFIKSYLRGTTLLDISKHFDVYSAVFDIIQNFVTVDCIHLISTFSKGCSIFSCLEELNGKVKLAKTIKSKHFEDEGEDIDSKNLDKVMSIIETLYTMVKPVNDEFEKVTSKSKTEDVTDDKEPLEDESEKTKKQREYVDTLKQYQFDEADILGDDAVPYKYKSESKFTVNKKYLTRITQELQTLQESPIHYDSSVFIRYDENTPSVIRVMITGPDDTPYDSGCFLFDCIVKRDYPKGPPTINIVDNGGKRFNPNLYANGYVCLSLLGTWRSSNPGEQWNPDKSTLNQVFVSIQSLILTKDPFFNEPGYESSYNSESGKKSSREYDENIRLYTMEYSMLKKLTTPPPYFKKVIDNHFRVKKEYVKKIVNFWVDDCSAKNKDKYTVLRDNIFAKLDEL